MSNYDAAMSEAEAEKKKTSHIEDQATSSDISLDDEFTVEEGRRIIHRIDRRLVTTCGFMYCISLMDRTNLPFAVIAGMAKELKLIGFRYNTIALVFFVTYTLCQPPMTVLCRKIGPRPFLATICLLWGAVMIGFGFVTVWTQMVALRIVLGIWEAGFFPGCVYLLSTWYARYDMHKRYSVFYLIGCVASAFSGILAYGLSHMNGVANKTGWRWIFIIEGIITCLIAVGGYFLLVDFPEKASNSWKFLSESEVQFIIRRVNKDRGDAVPESFTFARFLRPALDLKIWGFALIFFSVTTVTYAIAYFLPIILQEGLGYTVGAAQCLVAPPYAFAGIVMFSGAWIGDKYRIRGPILVFNSLLAIIGLPIMGFHDDDKVRYFGVFLVVAGANANIPAAMTYQANNIRGQWKRAFCSASLVGFGGIGGIAGSLVFRTEDKPTYVPGIIACIACNGLIIFIVTLESIYFHISNKKQLRGEKLIENYEGFRYTL